MDLVVTFRKSLAAHLSPRGLAVDLWRGGTRASGNLIEVSTSPQPTIFYTKASSNSPGFWGLTKNQLDRLSSSSTRWFCVFLHQSSSSGYLLSGGQVLARIRDGDLTLAGDGDYKVNERSEFVKPQHFDSIQTLVSRAL